VPEVEWYHWAMIALGVLGFVVQFIGNIIGVTWALAQVEKRLTEKITEERQEIEQAHRVAIETAKREVGETVSAIRLKIGEVETAVNKFESWVLKEFVRRDSFEKVIAEVRTAMSEMGRSLEKRFDKIDTKLDRK
jgi:hypothetical protein